MSTGRLPGLLLTGLVMAAVGYGVSYWYPLAPAARPGPTDAVPLPPNANPAAIRAQGRLEPVTGTLTVGTLPGEEIVELGAYVGKRVARGDVLAVVGSQEIRQAEYELAVKQLAKTRHELAAQRILAQLRSESAELSKQQALARRKETASAKPIELLDDRIKLARDQLTRLQQLRQDPRTRDAIADADIRQQQLLIEQLTADRAQGQSKLEAAREVQGLAESAAELDVKMAQASQQSLMDESGIEVLEQSVALAELGVQATQVRAPCDGTILEVYARVGERVANAPILQMGDLSRMVCICEVNEANLKDLEVREVTQADEEGKLVPVRPYRVSMSSPALEQDLTGRVVEVGRLIGAPALRDPNPLAQADLRTANVRIELDASSTTTARRFVHLQVNVTIHLKDNEDES